VDVVGRRVGHKEVEVDDSVRALESYPPFRDILLVARDWE
jgi:hypothetical protein